MSRPRGPSDGPVRDERIFVRVSAEELAEIERRAREVGAESTSAYVREVALGRPGGRLALRYTASND